MTKKITLSLDSKLIEEINSIAKENGKSISSIVENYFKYLSKIKSNEKKLSPKIQRLKRIAELPKNTNYKRELRKAINEKYNE